MCAFLNRAGFVLRAERLTFFPIVKLVNLEYALVVVIGGNIAKCVISLKEINATFLIYRIEFKSHLSTGIQHFLAIDPKTA